MQFYPNATKIKRWREERHWSQDHLADTAGIGVRTVQRIERGDRASYESIMALAAAFNVDVGALTVDPEQQAKADIYRDTEDKLSGLRLSLWISLAGYVVIMIIFGAISISDGQAGFSMLIPAVWCTVAVAGHGLAVFIVTVIAKYQRERSDR